MDPLIRMDLLTGIGPQMIDIPTQSAAVQRAPIMMIGTMMMIGSKPG